MNYYFKFNENTFLDQFFCSNDVNKHFSERNFTIYWNVPTFQCDSHKLNFTQLAEKYGITQNLNDRFQGEEIVILYDPGSFPAILKTADGSKVVFRNGGVPQEGNLTAHLELFEEIVDGLIPNKNFSGKFNLWTIKLCYRIF